MLFSLLGLVLFLAGFAFSPTNESWEPDLFFSMVWALSLGPRDRLVVLFCGALSFSEQRFTRSFRPIKSELLSFRARCTASVFCENRHPLEKQHAPVDDFQIKGCLSLILSGRFLQWRAPDCLYFHNVKSGQKCSRTHRAYALGHVFLKGNSETPYTSHRREREKLGTKKILGCRK